MPNVLRIVLIAEEAAGMRVLRMLAELPLDIVAVVTGGVDAQLDRAPVREVASRLRHRVWPVRLVKQHDFAEILRAEKVDILLNVHALFVLPRDVVAAPQIGSFNLHPGPLPQYAGLNAPSWAIYHGERTHAVTVHWMDAGIDTGPIAYQARFEMDVEETGLSLSSKCVRAGIPLIRELLEAVGMDPAAVPRLPQTNSPRRYYGRAVPHDGWLLWTEPAERIMNFVRACDYLPFTSPWGRPRSVLAGAEIEVLKTARTGTACDAAPGTVGRIIGREVLVAAGDEWVLVRRVRAGGTERAAAEVLKAGDRLSAPVRMETV